MRYVPGLPGRVYSGSTSWCLGQMDECCAVSNRDGKACSREKVCCPDELIIFRLRVQLLKD